MLSTGVQEKSVPLSPALPTSLCMGVQNFITFHILRVLIFFSILKKGCGELKSFVTEFSFSTHGFSYLLGVGVLDFLISHLKA